MRDEMLVSFWRCFNLAWAGILSLCIILNIAQAQNLPLNIIQNNLNNLPANASPQKEIAIPDPMQLAVTWWQYVDRANKDSLESRLNDFYERINLQIHQSTGADLDELLKIGSQIKANMELYARLKLKPLAPILPKQAALERYNITQLIDLLAMVRITKKQVNRDQHELDELDKRIKLSTRAGDTLTAAYLALDKIDPKKFHSGLNIIEQRFDRAIFDEQLKFKRLESSNSKNYLANLESSRRLATENLYIDASERHDIEQEISHAKNILSEAEAKLTKKQAENINQFNDNQIFSNEYQQSLLYLQVLHALAQTDLLSLLNERYLLAFLEEDRIDFDTLQNDILSYKDTLDDLLVKSVTWLDKNDTNRIKFLELTEDNPAVYKSKQYLLDTVQKTFINIMLLQDNIDDTQFLINLTEQNVLSVQGFTSRWLIRALNNSSNIWQITQEKLNMSLFKIGDTPVTALGFARLLFIIISAWWVAFWVNKILIRLGNKGDAHQLPAYYLVARLSYYLIILIGLFSGLAAVGIDFTSFALVAGALAIGLGFGLQSIVSNFVSGLILLFERSIKVGDFIELQGSGICGEVKEINVRATIICNNDSVDIIVPNSEFMNTKMLNWTLTEPIRRMRYPFRVSFDVDKEIVREVVLAAAEDLPHTLKGVSGRNPSVWLVGFGEYGYKFELVVWLTPRAVKRPNAVGAAYMWAIDNALRENNLTIPVPQQELRFRENSPPLEFMRVNSRTRKENLHDLDETE
ncbi:hypothetical protein AwWohl_08690 [Gammaproteobacteria bacterium]|nr:hypothetical protein AwWohl_08690 [Gammaproteobacteria bacterium]